MISNKTIHFARFLFSTFSDFVTREKTTGAQSSLVANLLSIFHRVILKKATLHGPMTLFLTDVTTIALVAII